MRTREQTTGVSPQDHPGEAGDPLSVGRYRVVTKQHGSTMVVSLLIPGGCLSQVTSGSQGREIARNLIRLLHDAGRVTEAEAHAMDPPKFAGPSWRPLVLVLIGLLLLPLWFAIGVWVAS